MRQKYYSIKNIIKLDAHYNIILGERSNGKSYAVKHEAIRAAIEDPENSKFIYLRRWDIDTKQGLVEQYFVDANIQLMTNGESELISAYQRKIYLAKYDEKTGKIIRQKHIGYYCALNMDEHYKSGIYTDCTNVIFEEFVSNNAYLPREPQRLQQFISTVARRNKIKVWLVGNTISRVCPYFNEWELRNIPRQKQGTIEIYEHLTDQEDEDGNPIIIKIAVEYAENSGNNSKMFFGTVAKQITEGVWQSEEKPHLPKKINAYESMHMFILEWTGFKFSCEFLIDKETGAVLWYVIPKTTPIKKGVRVVTDRTVADPYYTRGLIPLSPTEATAFSYLKSGQIFYSDNLTGGDFEICLKKLLTSQL